MTAHANGTLLPVPVDPVLSELVAAWPGMAASGATRATWLGQAEDALRLWYPTASSRSLSRTARSIAPFPLAQPGVG